MNNTPYNWWLSHAKRWDAAVNFGSPISAWSLAMLKEYREAQEQHRQPLMSNVK